MSETPSASGQSARGNSTTTRWRKDLESKAATGDSTAKAKLEKHQQSIKRGSEKARERQQAKQAKAEQGDAAAIEWFKARNLCVKMWPKWEGARDQSAKGLDSVGDGALGASLTQRPAKGDVDDEEPQWGKDGVNPAEGTETMWKGGHPKYVKPEYVDQDDDYSDANETDRERRELGTALQQVQAKLDELDSARDKLLDEEAALQMLIKQNLAEMGGSTV